MSVGGFHAVDMYIKLFVIIVLYLRVFVPCFSVSVLFLKFSFSFLDFSSGAATDGISFFFLC